jgi:phage shock protein A
MAEELPTLAWLEKMRSAIFAIARSRERVQAQIDALEQQKVMFAGQAAEAQQMGREDLVPAALARRQEVEGQLTELALHLSQLLGEEAGLILMEQRLRTRNVIYWSGLPDRDSGSEFDIYGRSLTPVSR